MLLQLLDWFFLIFHTGIIFFNLFGWLWKKTRVANLAVLLLTAFSWFFLGIWFGWGYCFCTDWHWQILQNLGEKDLPHSYITYLLWRVAPDLSFPQQLIDISTAALFFLALAASMVLNVRDFRRIRTNKNGRPI